MRERSEIVLFINRQFEFDTETTKDKMGAHHYGRQELKELLDFIFEGVEPKSSIEQIYRSDKRYFRDPNNGYLKDRGTVLAKLPTGAIFLLCANDPTKTIEVFKKLSETEIQSLTVNTVYKIIYAEWLLVKEIHFKEDAL